MKALRYLILIVCIFAGLCIPSGCKKDDKPQATVVPLEENVVVKMLDKAGLQGALSES